MIETGVAEIHGTQLYWEARGSGPPILFLHGFALDRRMWSRQCDALAASHRVVAFDARGFGRSAMPSTQPYKHCEDAAALIEHLGLERVTVVGHSIGAHQMLELALTRPDLVAAWASVCGSGLVSVPFPDDVLKMFRQVRAAAQGGSLEVAKRIWSEGGWCKARENPALAPELDAMLADYSGWQWTHENPVTNIEPPAAERLGALRMPALVITGGRDLPYNAEVGRALADGIPGAIALELPHASHMANMEDPDAVNRAIAALVVHGVVTATSSA